MGATDDLTVIQRATRPLPSGGDLAGVGGNGKISRRAVIKGGLACLAGVAGGGLGRQGAAFGEGSAFGINRLEYESTGTWEPRPEALYKLLQEVEKRTSILVDERLPAVSPDSIALFDNPFSVLSGDRGFELTEADRHNLEVYLRAGGTLLIDSAENDLEGEFRRSVERELASILPGIPLSRIPSAHVIYKSFYLIETPSGRTDLAPYMDGCELDGRLLVIYSHNDLLGAWARDNYGNWLFEVYPGGERQRELAFRLGINLAMYLLCLDYKEDQIHIPFILHRRQWRLE